MKSKWISIPILGALALGYGYGLPEFAMERSHGREKKSRGPRRSRRDSLLS